MITSLGHATSEDITFVGYKVPVDAIILADMDSVNNDRRTWGDPGKFRPERFIAEDGSLLKIEEFIPFFLGNSFSAIPYSTWNAHCMQSFKKRRSTLKGVSADPDQLAMFSDTIRVHMHNRIVSATSYI